MKTKKVSELVSTVSLLALLWGGCATEGGTSGETHFVCSKTPDCASHGDSLVCVEGQCVPVGAEGSDGGGTTGGSPNKPGGFAPDRNFGNVFVQGLPLEPCLPRTLTRVSDQNTGEEYLPCTLVEVFGVGLGAPCQLERGRKDPPPSMARAVRERLRAETSCDTAGLPSCTSFVMCEIREASDTCHHEATPPPEIGWCYVDPSEDPADEPSLVDSCPANQQRRIRFVDPANATPGTGAMMLIACWGG